MRDRTVLRLTRSVGSDRGVTRDAAVTAACGVAAAWLEISCSQGAAAQSKWLKVQGSTLLCDSSKCHTNMEGSIVDNHGGFKLLLNNHSCHACLTARRMQPTPAGLPHHGPSSSQHQTLR